MRRRLRLAGPAMAFAAVGGVLLVFGHNPEMRLEGGFATSGGYALALQLVLALFLLAVIDDLQEPLPMSRPGVGRLHATCRAMPADIRLALLQFYLVSPLAALALSFGFASSLGVLLSGLLDGTESAPRLLDNGLARSAEPMAVLLVVTSLAQLPARRAGVLGWCVGFAAGSSLAQIQFVAGVDIGLTWQRALVIVVALVVLWGIAHGVHTARRIQPG
jgi:hypothetical protein